LGLKIKTIVRHDKFILEGKKTILNWGSKGQNESEISAGIQKKPSALLIN
jgi:hypothetical protein